MQFLDKQKPIYFALDQSLVRRHHILKLSAAFLNIAALLLITVASLFTSSNKPAYAAAYTWDGGGATNNWSDCDNWSSNICPVAADTVTFNGTSTKASVVDASFGGTVAGITIASGYTGTITLGRSLSSTGVFTQASGSTFSAGSNTLSVATTFTISAGATFNGGTGTVVINGTANGALTCAGTATFNRVEFAHTAGIKTVNNGCNLPLGNNPTIPFSITNNGTLSGTGTLTATAGTITMSSTGGITGFTSMDLNTLTITGGSHDWSGVNSLNTKGNVTVSAGASFTTPQNLSAQATFTNNGTVNLGNTIADFNSSLVSNSGSTLTASSSGMTVAGHFTINSGATFNHNNGTVTFDGGSATLTCGNKSFHSVEFNGGPNTTAKTINSDCTLPVGANPSMGDSRFNLAGIISGSGVIAFPALLTVNPGAQLDGFSEMKVLGGTFTVSNGTNFTAPATADFNGAFVISAGGTFTAPSGNLSAAAAFTINSGATFNHNNGTIIFDGGGTVTCNDAEINFVKFLNISNVAVSSNCSLPVGHNPVLGSNDGPVTIVGELTGSGSLTALNTVQLRPGYNISDFNNISIFYLILRDGVTADFSGHNSLTLTNLRLQESSTLISGTWALPISGNITLDSGTTFTPNNGTVLLNGTDQILTGDITFYNLTKTSNTPATLTFASGSTISVGGTLTLRGTSANLLNLVSSNPGSSWNINAAGTRNLRYLKVTDSTNINNKVMQAFDSDDGGNNINWEFPSTAVDPVSAITNFGFAQASLIAEVTARAAQQNSSIPFANIPGINGAFTRISGLLNKMPGGQQTAKALARIIIGFLIVMSGLWIIIWLVLWGKRKDLRSHDLYFEG